MDSLRRRLRRRLSDKLPLLAAILSVLTSAITLLVRRPFSSTVKGILTAVQGDLKTYITDQGGAYASKVTDECTHLVANQKQYDTKGAKGGRYILISFDL